MTQTSSQSPKATKNDKSWSVLAAVCTSSPQQQTDMANHFRPSKYTYTTTHSTIDLFIAPYITCTSRGAQITSPYMQTRSKLHTYYMKTTSHLQDSSDALKKRTFFIILSFSFLLTYSNPDLHPLLLDNTFLLRKTHR